MATRARLTTGTRVTAYPESESTSPPTRIWFKRERRRPEFEKAVKDAQYDVEQLIKFWKKQANYAQKKADYWRRVREKELEEPEVKKWGRIQEKIDREKRKYLQHGRRVMSRMKSAFRIIRGR